MDPIVEASLNAVQGLFSGGRRGGAPPVPVRTEKSADPITSGIPSAGPGGGITSSFKSAGYLSGEEQTAGTALNPIAQLGLFAKIRKESNWLRYTSFAPVDEKTGNLGQWDDRNFRMKPTASTGPRPGIPLHRPDISEIEYSTKTLSGAFGIRLEAIKAAAKAGRNVNQLVQEGIASGIANVLADIGINGDASLPDDSDLNIQRGTADGWLQKIRDNAANYTGSANGWSYHNGLWAGMLQQIDKAYRKDPALAWGLSDTLGTRWLTEVTATSQNPSNSHPSIVNDLGMQLLNSMGAKANPLGRPGVVIPQMEDDMWSSDEGYTGIAPTSITNNGNGTLAININTLADSGTDRSSTGADGQRYVTVGRSSTGVEETLAVDFSTPNNTVTTTSTLGQTSVSTTASDYYVRWADCQSVLLAPMKLFTLVVKNGLRVYTVFYPRDEVIEVIIHTDIDYIVGDYDAVSLADDLITPRFDVLPN